jgi:hypothetical protein
MARHPVPKPSYPLVQEIQPGHVDIARSAVRLVDIGALTMHLLGQGLTLSAADVLDLQDLGPGRMSPDYVPPLLARFAQLYIDPAKVTTI